MLAPCSQSVDGSRRQLIGIGEEELDGICKKDKFTQMTLIQSLEITSLKAI
jgi:hypothetical protein